MPAPNALQEPFLWGQVIMFLAESCEENAINKYMNDVSTWCIRIVQPRTSSLKMHLEDLNRGKLFTDNEDPGCFLHLFSLKDKWFSIICLF